MQWIPSEKKKPATELSMESFEEMVEELEKIDFLRRAWDALDSFKQAYPENWHDDDQQVMDDLMKAALDLSGVKRQWVSLTEEDIQELHYQIKVKCVGAYRTEDVYRAIEAKLREKNT